MRIAVSGTHRTGKSTLVAALGERLPRHAIVAEPYDVLADRGYEFAHPPGVDDFVIQLKQSLISLRRRSPNLIFDRCPLDFLGYIAASPGAARFDLEAWRVPIARAMTSLDLVVAVHADLAHDPPVAAEDAMFRLAVDDALRDIVDADGFDLCQGVELLILDGPWDRRLKTVLTWVE
ncbi:MAG TPA: AAA family ATPase, partial [Thermomicrobiales bacterium]|nr:AAA family ATPase [Thermomicrobiales bacterium]